MTVLDRRRLPPQTGAAFAVRRGQFLKIIDPTGEQVCDLMSFALDDRTEWLSSGRSIDYANTIYMTTGHTLYTNRSRPMWTIVEDTVGRHDFLLTPCSPETFTIIYGTTTPHPSCFGNLARCLESFDIPSNSIPTTFNVFMNVIVGEDGTLQILPPRSTAGDYLVLRAEMDMIIGATACSAELSNNGSFKPIDLELHSSAPQCPPARVADAAHASG